MNITPISNYHFNSYKLEQQNKPENTSEKNTEYNQNKKYISYPANYYISFGNNLNISLIEQMQKTKDKKKLIELFRKMPQEIQENCEQLVLRFEKEKLSLEDYIKSCIKQPSLFWQSPDKIESNVWSVVNKFKKEGLSIKDYLSACIKQPSLFRRLPDTIEDNVKDLVKKFKNERLNSKDYLKACVKQPQLFYQSPDTIESNVRNLVKKFENEGLNSKDYLKACIKQPPLFCLYPDTIENNVRNLVKKFENEELNIKDFLRACVKVPSLFGRSPDTIESNVRNLVKKFEKEGLNSKDYLKACVKQPPLFCQSPDTIAEHINIMKFSNINSKSPLENNNFWEKILKYPIKLSFSSLTLLVKNLIIPKMFENTVIPKELKGNSSFVPKLKTYLENHPDNIFELNVKGTDKDIEVLRKCIDELCDGKNNPFTINHIK